MVIKFFRMLSQPLFRLFALVFCIANIGSRAEAAATTSATTTTTDVPTSKAAIETTSSSTLTPPTTTIASPSSKLLIGCLCINFLVLNLID